MNDLTAEEVALVEKYRGEQAHVDTALMFQREAIAMAKAFSDWSAMSGEGLTFSTFVNNFGYGYRAKAGAQLWEMYEAVKRIHDAAWPVGD